jgi:hypothetical protein
MVSRRHRHYLQVRPSSSGGSTSEAMTIRHHAHRNPTSCTPRSVSAPSSEADPGRVDPGSKLGGPGIEAYKFESRGTARRGARPLPRSGQRSRSEVSGRTVRRPRGRRSGTSRAYVPLERRRQTMSIDNALASVAVRDLKTSVKWYEKIFGRPADAIPMPGRLRAGLATGSTPRAPGARSACARSPS